jgi:phosphoribosyl 1,2-cyclic phosphate phosphodiesterase
MIIKFLGTGTSHGVPVVDCMMNNYIHCPKGVCQTAATDTKHNRTRSSIIIEYNNKSVIIDVGPDFRQQVLREKITRIDAAIFTHMHADHIAGLPDIRSYTRIAMGSSLPIYGTDETIDSISKTFSYIFDVDTFVGGGIPSLERNRISSPFTLFNIKFIPIPIIHGACNGAIGYRFNDIAYIPDVKTIPESSMALLAGVKTIIIDCLRIDKPHSTHLILPETLEIINKIKPQKSYLTHMCHDIHYIDDLKNLPENTYFAYDGLKLEI